MCKCFVLPPHTKDLRESCVFHIYACRLPCTVGTVPHPHGNENTPGHIRRLKGKNCQLEISVPKSPATKSNHFDAYTVSPRMSLTQLLARTSAATGHTLVHRRHCALPSWQRKHPMSHPAVKGEKLPIGIFRAKIARRQIQPFRRLHRQSTPVAHAAARPDRHCHGPHARAP
jgi:hypothetical protein